MFKWLKETKEHKGKMTRLKLASLRGQRSQLILNRVKYKEQLELESEKDSNIKVHERNVLEGKIAQCELDIDEINSKMVHLRWYNYTGGAE